MKKLFYIFILLVLFCPRSYSLSAGRTTHVTESSDGEYIFVFVSKDVSYEEEMDFFSDGYKAEMREIRNKYKMSGIFRKSDSKLLWPIEDPPYGEIVLNDGQTMIGFFKAQKTFERCIAFYSKGKIVKQYSVKDLVSFTSRCKVTGCWGYEWAKTDEMDKNENRYTLFTQTWDRYTFDPKTGVIISSRRASSILFYSILVIFGCVSTIILLIKKRKYNKRTYSTVATATSDDA